MAADIHLGAVYYEDTTDGEDASPDVIDITWTGGPAGGELSTLILNMDKNNNGILDPGETFFDTAGTNFGVGQAIVTPSILKAENIALARDWEQRGWEENVDAFKAALVVERNADDRCRADHLLQPDLVNQYRKGAALIQFIV